MKTTIIGSGSWGTALAQILADNGVDVTITGRNQNELRDMAENRRNQVYFGDLAISEGIKVAYELKDTLDASIFLLAVPTAAIEPVCLELNALVSKPVIIINVAKGFHPVTHELLSDVINRCFDKDKLQAVVSLIGPSHAEEVIERKLTIINAVSLDEKAAEEVQKLFSNHYFRVYTNNDVIGAQIGVAVKNIIALASGVLAGMGLGDNARAALISRGLAEMLRYGEAFGARPETFLGLCGVGDLVVTCMSVHSRNFQAGLKVSQDGGAKDFWAHNVKTVEGVFAAKVVHEVALEKNIEMPITHEVYRVFYEMKDPRLALQDLMMRDLKPEMKY